jgi:hypothetical protein
MFNGVKRSKGRPRGTSKKKPEEVANINTLLSKRTREFIEVEKDPVETYDQAIFRLLTEKGRTIVNLRKKVEGYPDTLRQETKSLHSVIDVLEDRLAEFIPMEEILNIQKRREALVVGAV